MTAREDAYYADPTPCDCARFHPGDEHTVGRHRYRVALGIHPVSGVMLDRHQRNAADADAANYRRWLELSGD